MNAPPALSETSDPASLWVIHSPAAPPPPAQRALQATCTCLARRKQRSQNRAPQVRAPAGKCGSKSPPPHAPACPTRAPLTLSGRRHRPRHRASREAQAQRHCRSATGDPARMCAAPQMRLHRCASTWGRWTRRQTSWTRRSTTWRAHATDAAARDFCGAPQLDSDPRCRAHGRSLRQSGE